MKNTKLKLVILLTGTLIVLHSSSTAYAQQQGYDELFWEKRKEAHREAIAEYLHLSPEQQEQLKEERSGHRNKMKELHLASKEKREELRFALEQENVDVAEVQRIADELKQIQAQTIDARIDGILTMKEILTPEQFKTFQEMVKERRGKRLKHGSRRQGYSSGSKEQANGQKSRG